MTRKRLFFALLAGLILAFLAGFFCFPASSAVHVEAESVKKHEPLGDGALKAVAPPGPIIAVDPGAFTDEQARVYAALGEVADGRREQMPSLDAHSRLAVEGMSRLLASQPIKVGAAVPTVGRSGMVSKISTGNAIVPPSTSNELTPTNRNGEHVSTPLVAAEGKKNLGEEQRTGSVTSGPDGHIITGHDVWAAIKAKPGRGLPVRIVDQGEGGHVIAVFGEDFGTVRVNGGLVVPGRYYRIQGSMEITGAVPLGIHIRPLSAVPAYHEQPVMAPNANG